ncbi:unnamed protein product [Nesidiocoris tenuis]|uniref:C3H1-type domain-containing protein n=1 Tax=Nesidiocoris tenuis TaxID=355587 RepID=A0A6H5G927_9HEMI|nr:unnamed protein product [Nesidiocoris tenuis]
MVYGGRHLFYGVDPIERLLLTTSINQIALRQELHTIHHPVHHYTPLYKTELCRPYEESGTCKYGEKCQFAHGGHELRCLVRHPKYKTELCRTFHSVGFCPYGPRCHFIHNAEEARSNGPPSGGKNRPRPLSLGGHNLSSESSLASTSPPSSLGSISPPPQHFGPFAALTPPHSPHSPPPPPASPESRLPVFNRISAPGTPSAAMANNLHSHGHHSHVPLLLNMRFGSGELSVVKRGAGKNINRSSGAEEKVSVNIKQDDGRRHDC